MTEPSGTALQRSIQAAVTAQRKVFAAAADAATAKPADTAPAPQDRPAAPAKPQGA